MKRTVTLFLVLSLFCVLTGSFALAADFPSKPIKLIVPWGAGGNADVQARILAKVSEKFLG